MTNRRLAALLMADVAGYSLMVGNDEAGTLASVKALKNEIIEPALTKFAGRLVKTMGDGFLIEFGSAVKAAECAISIQQQLADWGQGREESQSILLRIGVHIGDIVVDDAGDVFGDGVNVTARLQAIADPGCVCLSGDAFRQVEGKLALALEDVGEQLLKNIVRPMRVFRWAGTNSDTASPMLRLPDKPSIAVLPFVNMSGDPEQEYFADGMVEEIITALSRMRWLFVIARNSSFTYKGRAVDVKVIGRELGVRYVLEGSVRKKGSRLRISGQLVDTTNGSCIWASQYDRELVDVFELQDELTRNVITAIEPSLRVAEIARSRMKPTNSLEAYDYYLHALAELHLFTDSGLERAEALLRKAVDRDANFSDALARLSDCILKLVSSGLTVDRHKSEQEAKRRALEAIRADPNNGFALAIGAWALSRFVEDKPQALDLAELALKTNPSSTYARARLGWAFVLCGDQERAQEQFNQIYRLSPVDPERHTTDAGIAATLLFSKNFTKAAQVAARAHRANPAPPISRRILAASLMHLGRTEEAREVVAALLISNPNESLSASAPQPWVLNLTMREIYYEALRRAGLPE